MNESSPAATRPRTPVGPKGYPVVGILPRIWRDPLTFFVRTAEEHGGVVRMSFGGARECFLVSDPACVEDVLQTHSQNYWKGLGMEVTRGLLGDGIATSEGDTWRVQRQRLQPAFTRERLGALVPLMGDIAAEHAQNWTENSRSDWNLTEAMNLLTQDIIFRTLFSAELGEDAHTLARAFAVAQEQINFRAWFPLAPPDHIPTLRNLRYRRALRDIDRIVYGVMERRAGTVAVDAPPDLLSVLLRVADAKGRMEPRQLRDELVTLFFAGYETTASALTWTWHLLADRPDLVEAITAEADHVLSPGAVTADQVEGLELTGRVLDESMRLYPPGWIMVRTAREADVIGEYAVPAGATLLLSPWVTHRRSDVWEDPLRFDPNRFLPGAPARPRFAYYPFGGGPRVCIGKPFAHLILRIALATTVKRCTIEPERTTLAPKPLTTLRPKRGLRASVRERDEQPA